MARERTIVIRTRELLKSAGAKTYKTDGQGEPDILGVYKGFAFAIECKRPGQTPEPLQVFRMQEWKRSGAITFWTDNPVEALAKLQDRVAIRFKTIRERIPANGAELSEREDQAEGTVEG